MNPKPEAKEEAKVSTKSEDTKGKSEAEPKKEEAKETKTTVKSAEESNSNTKTEEPKTNTKAEVEEAKKDAKDGINLAVEKTKTNQKADDSNNMKSNSSVESSPLEDMKGDESKPNKPTDVQNKEETKSKEGSENKEDAGSHEDSKTSSGEFSKSPSKFCWSLPYLAYETSHISKNCILPHFYGFHDILIAISEYNTPSGRNKSPAL